MLQVLETFRRVLILTLLNKPSILIDCANEIFQLAVASCAYHFLFKYDYYKIDLPQTSLTPMNIHPFLLNLTQKLCITIKSRVGWYLHFVRSLDLFCCCCCLHFILRNFASLFIFYPLSWQDIVNSFCFNLWKCRAQKIKLFVHSSLAC